MSENYKASLNNLF